MRLAEFISQHREQILSEWERGVRALPAGRDLPRLALRDHVPELLSQVADVLAAGRGAGGLAGRTSEHAAARLGAGFDLREVAAEYRILRGCVLGLWSRSAPEGDTLGDVLLLDAAIDAALSEAVDLYAQTRERTLAALDRISTAALVSDDASAFLPELLRVLLASVPSVETGAVLIRDDDGALRVRAAVGLEADHEQDAAQRVGEGFAGRVAATREPLLIRDVAHHPLVRSEAVRRLGLRVLYGVPMVLGEELHGVVHIGSRTAAEFSPEDRALFQVMVHRATALLAQKQATQRLREARARFEGVFEQTVVGICLADMTGRFLLANQRYAEIVGRGVEKLRALRMQEITHPDDLPGNLVLFQRMVADGTPFGLDKRYLRPDGSVVWVHNSVSLVRDPGGARFVVAVTQDITDRRRAEEALRASQARHAAIVSSAFDCIVSMDHEGRVIEFNPAAERTFGVTRAQALGREMAELMIPPSLRDRHRAGLARYLATGEGPILGRPIEIVARRPDGAEFPVELTVTAVTTEGPPTFTGFLRDITERRRTGETVRLLAEASRALAESLDYATTLDRIARIALPTFADWCIVDVARPDGTLERRAVAHADPAHAADLRAVALRYPPAPDATRGSAAVFRTGRPELAERITDAMLVAFAQDDEHLRVLRNLGLRSYLSVPLRARDRTLGVVTFVAAGSGRSYTEADLPLAEELGRRAAQALENAELHEQTQHAAEELRRDAEFRERFMGVLGHDLRTPLNSITFTAATLLRREEIPAAEGRALRRIALAADRMTRMINELLDLTRARQGGGIPIERRPSDLHATCRQVIEELEVTHPERVVEFTTQGSGAGDWDADRVAQAVSNLVSNALSYSPPETPVRVAVRDEGDAVSIEVHNDGPPIAPELRATLFDPYRRGGEARQQASQGLGLGLYIVREIARAHGGEVTVESSAEAGTTLLLRLRRAPAA